MATEKLPSGSPHVQTATSSDMEGHAKKCVETCCELAKNQKTTQQLHNVSTPCLDHHPFKEEELASGRRIVKSLLTNCSEFFILGTYWKHHRETAAEAHLGSCFAAGHFGGVFVVSPTTCTSAKFSLLEKTVHLRLFFHFVDLGVFLFLNFKITLPLALVSSVRAGRCKPFSFSETLMQAAWILRKSVQHWKKTGLRCGCRAPMTIPRPSRQGYQGSCKCGVRRPQPPQGLVRFRRLRLAASACDVTLCCCFRLKRVVSLSINRPTITFATNRSMLIRCSPSKREISCSVHGDVPEGAVQCGSCDSQAGVLLSRLTFLHSGRHPLALVPALLHVPNPPPSQTYDSGVWTGTGESPWERLVRRWRPHRRVQQDPRDCDTHRLAATPTHLENGGLRTNLVKQPNRRLLGCEADARLPYRSRSSVLEWSLGPKTFVWRRCGKAHRWSMARCRFA